MSTTVPRFGFGIGRAVTSRNVIRDITLRPETFARADRRRPTGLAPSRRHLRILLSEISRREEIDEPLHGRIGLMIRLLDLGRQRGSIFRSALKERVR
jgi:hypothetical protein